MSLSRRQFGAAAAASLISARAARGQRHRPSLLLIVVVEQFRPDYLVRWQSQFSPGGFRRLMEEGAVCLDCRNLASTFPASSLATLGTGCYPSTHGIVADYWWDPLSRERIRAAQPLLQATTLGDEIVRAGGRVYGIDMNGEHAPFLAGSEPQQVFSMDGRGRIAAGAARAGDIPWFSGFQQLHDADHARDEKWIALGAAPGSPPLRVLRYDAARPEDFYLLFRASPFAQATLFELVRELIEHEKLGRSETLDCVMVVAGATALLGYETGADSPLMQQLVLHLDRHLEATLDYLGKAIGSGGYSVVFAGAHGAATLRPDRRAVSSEALAKAVNEALGGDAVDRYVYPFLYLKAGPRTREGRLAAARAALKVPGIAGYYTSGGECSHSGAWRDRFENSFHMARSGDVLLTYAPEYGEDYGPARGISYGTLYNYDAQTAAIFCGPQFASGSVERTVEAVDIAATVARAYGLPLPSSCTGAAIAEAFAPTTRDVKDKR
jgi:hypothetical protein